MSFGEMCSFFYQAMETSAVEGDLSDVVLRAGGGGDPVTKDFQDLSAKASPLSPEAIKPAPASAAAPLVSVPQASGVKRRKGQAKRVICIPAPAPGDQESSSSSSIKSSTGSVVVPSDLWAWRKYGQKPIKGSPYPRGYYRCSSSKGCSARKQVERSRSDPNMLVITYTSDHNHPWPTHRNSLAGSTRSSQPSKTTHNTPKSPSNSKQEQEDIFLMTSSTTSPLEVIKEENLDLDRIFDQSYKDMGFFDELGGLEPDPMSFFFSSSRENKGLDPLSFFDWDGN